MSTRLMSLCFDANDPLSLARFWGEVLGWEVVVEHEDEVELRPTDGTSFVLLFLAVPEPKAGKNGIHLDVVADDAEQQAAMTDRLIEAGARHVDVGQGDDVSWVVLADPEGNEFCIVRRGEFLATTGVLGSIVFEPADYPVVGQFWSAATGWPIVYDQDGDLAIRHPSGQGPFITFGPPVPHTKTGKNRLHLDVAPPPDGDKWAEVARLKGLGARETDIGQGDVTWVVMADPAGNEFCVLSPQ